MEAKALCLYPDDAHRELPGDEIGHRGARAAIRDLPEIGNVRDRLEQLADEVIGPADPAMSVGDLAGVGLDVRDQLGERVHRHGRVHRDRQIADRNAHDRIEILDRIVQRL